MKSITGNDIQQNHLITNDLSSSTKKVNILLVDDHRKNLLALEAVLMSPDYRLVTATSGREAIKCLLNDDFAVILLDVQMPGLNGFETAKLIKARKKTRHIPIIFITAISQEMEHVHQGYSVGAIDYIFKPYHPETLKHKVEQFVKIYKNINKQLDECDSELHEANQKLDRTTLNLKRTESLAKVIGETITDSIVTFDENETILTVNPAIRKMFGYDVEELISQKVTVLFGKPLLNIKQTLGKVNETIAVRKDRHPFPADIQIGKTTVEQQSIYVCTIRDISERKQIEELKNREFNHLEQLVEERTYELINANELLQQEIEERNKIAECLLRSQERFKRLFESSPCLMAVFSVNEEVIIDINSSWSQYTGFSPKEIVNNQEYLQHMFMDEDDELWIDIKEQARNKRILYKTKEGELRSGLLSNEFIDFDDEQCMLIVLTDITDKVHFKKEMYRLDRLNLIGEMAAGIAHEIRNPMTTVHGFLQLSKNEANHLPGEIIELMIEELNRANSIITEFLNLAKNKVSVKRKQALNDIIQSIYPLIQAEALRSSKYIELDLGRCQDIYLDQKEIRQLILNITLNGLDAVGSGGKVIIRTYVDKQSVILAIQDEGAGMSPDVLEKIGTPFFTTKETGTGLGLAICYSVAERHQAEIKVQSGSAGTVFSVHFKRD